MSDERDCMRRLASLPATSANLPTTSANLPATSANLLAATRRRALARPSPHVHAGVYCQVAWVRIDGQPTVRQPSEVRQPSDALPPNG